MTIVPVKASRNYDVMIGAGLLEDLGKRVRQVTNADTAAIISDDNVGVRDPVGVRLHITAGGDNERVFIEPPGAPDHLSGFLIRYTCHRTRIDDINVGFFIKRNDAVTGGLHLLLQLASLVAGDLGEVVVA